MTYDQLVSKIHDSGMEAIEKKLLSDQLEGDMKPFLCSLQNELEEAASEKERERLAMGSKQYRDYVARVCLAKAEAARAKIRYESFLALFEAKRSEGALEREKIAKGIFHAGR